MEIFEFKVDESFLGDPAHPIPIPKGQLSYEQLEAAGLAHQQVTVILPQDERFQAEICHCDVAAGYQYLLRFNGGNRKLPGYLKPNDHLLVILGKTEVQSYAVIEYCG